MSMERQQKLEARRAKQVPDGARESTMVLGLLDAIIQDSGGQSVSVIAPFVLFRHLPAARSAGL